MSIRAGQLDHTWLGRKVSARGIYPRFSKTQQHVVVGVLRMINHNKGGVTLRFPNGADLLVSPDSLITEEATGLHHAGPPMAPPRPYVAPPVVIGGKAQK